MLTARGQVITFDGFIRVYQEGTDEENSEQLEGQLPAVSEGDLLTSSEITATNVSPNTLQDILKLHW